MGLLNDVKKAAETVPAEKEDKKAKSKERKQAKREALQAVLKFVGEQKNLPENIKKAIEDLTPKAGAGTSAFGPSKIVQIFGSEKPAKGASISAYDVFTKTGLGYPEMRKWMRKWADAGIKVELDAATQSYVVR